MKIAVASTGSMVAGHFGHCDGFQVFESENGTVTAVQRVPNPGHKPGVLPNLLGDLGVKVIIAGGMGGGAVDICLARQIEVVVGVEGDARTAAERYLRGELKSTGVVCHQHAHADQCASQHGAAES